MPAPTRLLLHILNFLWYPQEKENDPFSVFSYLCLSFYRDRHIRTSFIFGVLSHCSSYHLILGCMLSCLNLFHSLASVSAFFGFLCEFHFPFIVSWKGGNCLSGLRISRCLTSIKVHNGWKQIFCCPSDN